MALVRSVVGQVLERGAPRSPARRALRRCARSLEGGTEAVREACVQVLRHSEAACLVYPYEHVPASLRAERADALFLACAFALAHDPASRPASFWLKCVHDLDRVLIVAPPDGARVALAHALIAAVQAHCDACDASDQRAPRKRLRHAIEAPRRSLPTASAPVHEYAEPPDLGTFQRHCVSNVCAYGRPFVARQFAQSWPALERWQDPAYLLRRAGPGRHVPVESGRTYTDPQWGQGLWPWAAFLAHIQWGRASAPRAPTLYLAQHTLLTQFPWLADDFTTPAYAVHGTKSPAAHGRAAPVVQVWMGPAATTSPAHTDPYYNCYVQVVGHKLVWLAPPPSDSTGGLCVHGGPEDEDVYTRWMSNTSRVDVFGPLDAAPAAFQAQVVPCAEWVYLHPGDLLFVPPGWWHAMQSTTQVCAHG